MVGLSLCGALELPDEVFRLIIAKLPLEHRYQLRAVCKQWNATLHDVHFLKQHFHLTSRAPLCFWSTGEGFASYNPETDSWRRFPTSFVLKEDFWRDEGDESIEGGNPQVRGDYHKVFGSDDGLLLVETLIDEERMLFATNPLTRSHRKLTEIPSWDIKILRMTLDRSSNSYKIFGAKYGHRVPDRVQRAQRNEGSVVQFSQGNDCVSVHVGDGNDRIRVHVEQGSDGTNVRAQHGNEAMNVRRVQGDDRINLHAVEGNDRGNVGIGHRVQGNDRMNLQNANRGQGNGFTFTHHVRRNEHLIEALRDRGDKRRQNTLYMYDSELDSWKSIGRWKRSSSCDVKCFGLPTLHRGVLHFLLTEDSEEPRGRPIQVLRFDGGKSWHELTAPIRQDYCLSHLFEWKGNLMLACVVERDENYDSFFPTAQILQLDEEKNIWVKVTTMSHDLRHRFSSFYDRLGCMRQCHSGEGYVFFASYCRGSGRGYKFVRHFTCDLSTFSWWELPEPHRSYRNDPPDFHPFLLKSNFDTVC